MKSKTETNCILYKRFEQVTVWFIELFARVVGGPIITLELGFRPFANHSMQDGLMLKNVIGILFTSFISNV